MGLFKWQVDLKGFCQYWAITCFLLPTIHYHLPRQESHLYSSPSLLPLSPSPYALASYFCAPHWLWVQLGLCSTYSWWASSVWRKKGPCLQTFTLSPLNLGSLPLRAEGGRGEQMLFSHPGATVGQSFAFEATTLRHGFHLLKIQYWVTMSLLLVFRLISVMEKLIVVFTN